jgi:UDP-N-acetylmuramate--alanine ligase
MIDFKNIANLYFLGIGGIGMSALARYANAVGKNVAGYDLTETPLTQQLVSEGIAVHYTDDINQLPNSFSIDNTLVVRTPAVPESHGELQYLLANGYPMVKRSELLGYLTSGRKCIAVAGTHGKTSVSTMITHLLHEAGMDVGAFLGGISRNFDSNLVLPQSPSSLVVTEADEYDRSFLQLHPEIAVVTSIDADHLDIYGNYEHVKEAFGQFVCNVVPNGKVLFKKGVNIMQHVPCRVDALYYSITEEADFYIKNLQIVDGHFQFDFITPFMIIREVKTGYPGRVNLENMVAAASVAMLLGADPMEIKQAIPRYKGVSRRFDIRFRNEQVIYIDDYGHHPAELTATINSVKELYAGKKVLGIFQPHLYSRTNDFALEFAQSLDLLDEAIVLDIYPARELPMPGVTSDIIFSKMKSNAKWMLGMNDVLAKLEECEYDVLLTMGAGNIDKLIEPIVTFLTSKYKAK